MANNNDNIIGNILNNEVTLLWKNNIIQTVGFPKQDGKYNIRLVDEQFKKIDCILGKLIYYKIGSIVKIYLLNMYGTKIIYKEFSIKKNTIREINVRPGMNEEIIKFLLQQCPDIQQVLNISNFSIAVDNAVEDLEDNHRTRNKNKKKISRVKTDQENDDERFKKLQRFMGRNFPVKGNIQSGKTKFMICTALWFLLQNKSSLFILRNFTDDKDQFRARTDNMRNKIGDELEKHGFDRNMFQIVCVDKNNINSEAIRGDTPKIMIALYNNSQLKNFYDLIGEEEKNKYVVFIDEADMLHKTVTGNETTENEALTASVYLDKIVKDAFCSFSVSGTILDAILKNNIRAEDLIVLKPSSSYRSHNTFLVDHLELPCKFTSSTSESILENDPNIIPYLHEFSNLKKINTFYNEKHPNYCLFRVADVIKPMEDFFKCCAKEFPNIVLMEYHGAGLQMHHSKINKIIKLSNGIESNYKNNIHSFRKGVTPSHILEWLKNNGGVDKFPHIVTIAGDLASRGISFGSADFAQCINNNRLGWHLTRMYATFAKSTDLPELLQITGRLCIVSFDGMPLTISMTKKDHENLIKGFNITEEFINRAKKQAPETILHDFVRDTPMFKKKVPRGRHLTKFENFKPKKVTEKEDLEAGGWLADKDGNYILKKVVVKTTDNMGKEIEVKDMSQVTKEGILFGEEEKEVKPVEEEEVEEEDSVIRLEKIKNAYNKTNSVINKIINKFVVENFRSLTKEELKLCGVNNIANYDRWNLGKSCQYKIIEKNMDGKYILRKTVIESLKI
jgi:hypothetical protein